MFWRFWGKSELLSAGELARRIHSRWLTRALRSTRPYPKIPLRRVSEGGFSSLLAHPRGRQIADAWWATALAEVDDDHPSSTHARADPHHP